MGVAHNLVVAEKSKSHGWIPIKGKRLISLPKRPDVRGPTALLLIINEYWDSFPEAMQPGPEPDHSPPPCNSEVWTATCLHGVHRNFT